MKRLVFIYAIIHIFILASCTTSNKNITTEILVAAASSLTPALTEIATGFEKINKDIQVTFSFGSSGKLAQQIKGGAPVDVFISASSSDMDILVKDNKIKLDSRTEITRNSLVIIHSKYMDISLLNAVNPFLSKIDHFTIGNPETVPAGVYAKETLTALGEWEALESKLVFGKDVRQVLTFVETGNADMGIVFASDAKSSNKIEIIMKVDPVLHSPVVYPGAIVRATTEQDASYSFLDYLRNPEAQEILAKYGFEK